MLERTDIAGHSLRPASLLGALRERTRDLHTQAERSGIIAGILDDAGAGAVFTELGENQRKARGAGPRQAQQHRIRKTAG